LVGGAERAHDPALGGGTVPVPGDWSGSAEGRARSVQRLPRVLHRSGERRWQLDDQLLPTRSHDQADRRPHDICQVPWRVLGSLLWEPGGETPPPAARPCSVSAVVTDTPGCQSPIRHHGAAVVRDWSSGCGSLPAGTSALRDGWRNPGLEFTARFCGRGSGVCRRRRQLSRFASGYCWRMSTWEPEDIADLTTELRALLNEWDPIGYAELGGDGHEYDGLNGFVLAQLADGNDLGRRRVQRSQLRKGRRWRSAHWKR
jgi:hypothetical protein